MGKYKIVAIIGEAGSGKDTLLNIFFENNNKYHKIISCTTRPKREGEKHGINYYYYTDQEFANKIINNEILEACIFNNWCYGTSIDGVREDMINVGVFNPEGIESLLAHPDVDLLKVYYVKVRPKIRLIRQLTREENPNINEIIRRYKTDEEDFWNLPFTYTILDNESPDDLFAAADEILRFLDETY